jgi:hypothetical protein
MQQFVKKYTNFKANVSGDLSQKKKKERERENAYKIHFRYVTCIVFSLPHVDK